MPNYADRVEETTLTTGNGLTLTLAGAVTGKQTFVAGVTAGSNRRYTLVSGDDGWEIGTGTLRSGPDELDRDTVLSNSNGDTSRITLTGTTRVFCDLPASDMVALGVDFVKIAGQTMTGVLDLPAGTASLPALVFNSDTDTGFYSPGANQLALSSGGSDKFVLDTSGNFVITPPNASSGTLQMSMGASGLFQTGTGINITTGTLGTISNMVGIAVDSDDVGGGRSRAFKATGNAGTLVEITSDSTASAGLLKITNNSDFDQLIKLSSSDTLNEGGSAALDINLTGSGKLGNFLRFDSIDGQVYGVDVLGNTVTNAGFIAPRIGAGLVQNLLKSSEDPTDAAWTNNSITFTYGDAASPDGVAARSTKVVQSSNPASYTQTATGTTANKTFSAMGWINNIAGNPPNLRIDSTNETGTAVAGEAGVNGKWQTIQVSQTFTGSSTGSPVYVMTVPFGGSFYAWAHALFENDGPAAYVATPAGKAIAAQRGMNCNGVFRVSAGYDTSRIEILEGENQSGNLFQIEDNNGVSKWQINSTFDLVLDDAIDFTFGTTTGTKLGTATSEKLAFWGSTPVIQQSGTGEATGFTAGAGTGVNDDSTFTGNVGATAYRVNDIIKALKNTGIMAS